MWWGKNHHPGDRGDLPLHPPRVPLYISLMFAAWGLFFFSPFLVALCLPWLPAC